MSDTIQIYLLQLYISKLLIKWGVRYSVSGRALRCEAASLIPGTVPSTAILIPIAGCGIPKCDL